MRSKRKVIQMKFVKITWKDAQSVDGWTLEEEINGELAVIVSVGILVKKTKESITLAVNKDMSNGAYSCIMSIPSKWVVEIKPLK